jgi:hypothetical protein
MTDHRIPFIQNNRTLNFSKKTPLPPTQTFFYYLAIREGAVLLFLLKVLYSISYPCPKMKMEKMNATVKKDYRNNDYSNNCHSNHNIYKCLC